MPAPGVKPPKRDKKLNLYLTAEELAALDELTLYYRTGSRQATVAFIAMEWKEGGLCIIDRNSRPVLIGAARDEILREARRVARSEIDARLWELGFISSDPGQ